MTTSHTTLTATVTAALFLLGSVQAQPVHITTVATKHGMGVGVGVSWVGVRCNSGTPKFQFPTNNPTPTSSGPNNASIVGMIVSPTQIVRVARKAQATAELNPLEVEFTCVNKQVKVQAGKYINLMRK